ERGQRFAAAHVLHDDVALAVFFARIVDRQDVRMLQQAGEMRFIEKQPLAHALLLFGQARLVRVQLQRNVALVIRVVTQIHRARTALAERPRDHVFAERFEFHASCTQAYLPNSNTSAAKAAATTSSSTMPKPPPTCRSMARIGQGLATSNTRNATK